MNVLWVKRVFDRICAAVGLVLFSPLMVGIAIMIRRKMGAPVFYCSARIGQFGEPFTMIKFRTMLRDADKAPQGSITTGGDPRITPLGAFLRRFKLDELPELWNVLKGDMSLVGPRPDVPGYADQLQGEDREVLQLKPGITGPVTLKYANEEALLAEVDAPVRYNNEVIFPDKVRINREYLHKWSIWKDLRIIWKTVFLLPQNPVVFLLRDY